MQQDRIHPAEFADAMVARGAGMEETVQVHGHYEVVCVGADGAEKWRDTIENLVTTVGKNLLLDSVLGNSAAGAVVMGLKGTGSAAAGDTQASHSGWSEVGNANAPTYSGTRKTPAFSSASSGSKTTSSAVAFSMTGSGTVAGCFINMAGSSTIDNTTGTLFSAGDFSGGSKTVTNGDTLNVTYTLSV
jgi:hypothetical protein